MKLTLIAVLAAVLFVVAGLLGGILVASAAFEADR